MLRACVFSAYLLAIGTVSADSIPTMDLLLSRGAVHGQAVNANGQALADYSVRLTSLASGKVFHAATDTQGRFSIAPIQPGLYQLDAAETKMVLRVWAEQSAPPKAGNAVLITTQSTSRGQGAVGGGVLGASLGTTVAIVTTVTVATVVGVTAANNSKKSTP